MSTSVTALHSIGTIAAFCVWKKNKFILESVNLLHSPYIFSRIKKNVIIKKIGYGFDTLVCVLIIFLFLCVLFVCLLFYEFGFIDTFYSSAFYFNSTVHVLHFIDYQQISVS